MINEQYVVATRPDGNRLARRETGVPLRGRTRRVAIIGGGPSGLLAGVMLGRRGHEVTVVERDAAPPLPDSEAVFQRWDRRGVPQARQPHIFLGRSVRVLRDETPDVLDDLLAPRPSPCRTGHGSVVKPIATPRRAWPTPRWSEPQYEIGWVEVRGGHSCFWILVLVPLSSHTAARSDQVALRSKVNRLTPTAGTS